MLISYCCDMPPASAKQSKAVNGSPRSKVQGPRSLAAPVVTAMYGRWTDQLRKDILAASDPADVVLPVLPGDSLMIPLTLREW